MTNDEYLKELASRGDGSLQAWFDAEHVDSTRSAKRAAAVERLRDYESWADGVDNCSLLKAVIGVDSWGIKWKENRDALIDLLTDEPTDTQRDINGTCPDAMGQASNAGDGNSGTAEAETSQLPESDSREKLEADARDLQSRIWDAGSRHDGISMSHIIELLDRQAEITAEESAEAWEDYSDSVQREMAELQDELAKRDKGITRLKRQRDEARYAAEYWRGQVQLCLDSAYPKSHAPERGYHPNVMGYPDRHGCATPSTLVSDVIDGLRDAAQDGFFKARLGDVVKLEAERDEWKAKAEQAERAMNSAAGKWAKADEENRGLRKALVLDDGTVEDYTERVDPLTALAHQKQLAEEWRDRCHNAEALCDKLEAERDALQVEYERAVHDAQTLYVKTEAERDEWKAKYLGAMNDVEDYKTLWHSSCDERDEWIARAKAEKLNSDGHWRNANRIAKERDALARDLAECEREREEWRAKVGAMLDAADAIRSLA